MIKNFANERLLSRFFVFLVIRKWRFFFFKFFVSVGFSLACLFICLIGDDFRWCIYIYIFYRSAQNLQKFISRCFVVHRSLDRRLPCKFYFTCYFIVYISLFVGFSKLNKSLFFFSGILNIITWRFIIADVVSGNFKRSCRCFSSVLRISWNLVALLIYFHWNYTEPQVTQQRDAIFNGNIYSLYLTLIT